MTKVGPQDIIGYLRDVNERLSKKGKRPLYDDYIFPVELTAKCMAERFHVTASAIGQRMMQLESDNIVISKRGYIDGMRVKRLVYFIKDDLVKNHIVSTPNIDWLVKQIGKREFIHLMRRDTSEINERGDALHTIELRILNSSEKEASEISIPRIKYGVTGKNDAADHLREVWVDGAKLKRPASAIRVKKVYKRGLTGLPEEEAKEGQRVELFHFIRLDRPLKPGATVDIRLVMFLRECYANMAESECHVLTTAELFVKRALKLVPPKGYRLCLTYKSGETVFKHGIAIFDSGTEERNYKLEDKIIKPVVTEDFIYWEVENPIIGYSYMVRFYAEKAGARRGRPSSSKSSRCPCA
ncbi:MAG: hypothetical protein HZB92_03280 [Euryarchaeota archaeon]|nr:hypothetical protein [Euryarchaeota archaeon]